MAPDYYADEMQHEQMIVLPSHIFPDHIEHCLDMLRQYLMCQPSSAIWTYDWDESKNKDNPADDLHIEHQCVDWEMLDGWARERVFDIEDGLVLRPDGTPYRGSS
ncbi:hypothetical protein LTR78_006788 [Recurvomyces mirabilis]|uniref:Uncharacterized protein n=1 Tax=Recurvomyces mirabilis TaxID=574656 RepID=A0AAE0WK74_9PEZI|nr:hypothetical protein LTR78_006788 [Recurvomyces mirabilis]